MSVRPKSQVLAQILAVFVLLLIASLFPNNISFVPLSNAAVPNLGEESPEDLFSKSNIAVSAYENVTFVPVNNSIELGNSSLVLPADLTLEVARGFEPASRFNSGYVTSLQRSGNSRENSLVEVEDGIRLFFISKDTSKVAVSMYNMSFMQSVNVSRSDYISLAISTNSSFDSSEGYVGVALLLRDQQGARQYVSIYASGLSSVDTYSTSQWFLGSSLGQSFPYYGFRYGSTSGPWFIQLALAESFSSLGLSSAMLEGFLVGAELFSIPLPYNTTQADVRFHYALVHPQPFSINERLVNSSRMKLGPSRFLNISGISCNKLKVAISGSLRPSDGVLEKQQNGTVEIAEVSYDFPDPLFYNFSESIVSELHFEGKVNVTVPSKTVKECILTFNNQTTWDLTNAVLSSSEGGIYSFPSNTRTLKVHLVLYRFNAWLLWKNPLPNATFYATKTGITGEYFSPEKNEVAVSVDLGETAFQEPRIAIRTGGGRSGSIIVNDVQKPVDSLLQIDNDLFLGTLLRGQGEEDDSPYLIKCTFSQNPIYSSLTKQPFNVFIDNTLFEIYTPFNCEARLGVQTPMTLKAFTFRTYVVNIEHDQSVLEFDNDLLMIDRFSSFSYFMFKPLREGSIEIKAHFTDPSNQSASLALPFLVSTQRLAVFEIATYLFFAFTVLSFVYVVSGSDLAHFLKRLRKRSAQTAQAQNGR
jgi:hypothetical protein